MWMHACREKTRLPCDWALLIRASCTWQEKEDQKDKFKQALDLTKLM